MTEEKLTEQRDGQNVIALRQDGKRSWAITSAGMGDKSTRFLYGEYADKLAEYEAIGTPDECREAMVLLKQQECKKTKTNYDICCESMEAMAQIIDIAKIGWTKEQIIEWLQKEECEVLE